MFTFFLQRVAELVDFPSEANLWVHLVVAIVGVILVDLLCGRLWGRGWSFIFYVWDTVDCRMSKFTFKKNAERIGHKQEDRGKRKVMDQVIDLEDSDSDDDFADKGRRGSSEILTNDSSTGTDTESLGGSTSRREKDKLAWSGLMTKMQKPQLSPQKMKETQTAWKGLMSKMQRNDSTSSSKSKSSKRTTNNSKPLSNPNVKRLKIDNKPSPAKSPEVVTLDDVEVNDCHKPGAAEENGEKTGIEKNVPLHPIFRVPSNTSPKENVENEAKPWELLHIYNPWACTSEDLEKAPEVVHLNEDVSAATLVARPQSEKIKNCPFYKKMPGTKFSVDAFNFGVIPGIDVYLLSHFHSDHYVGLSKKFSKTVVCSIPTGNLIKMKLGVEENCIRKLRLNKRYLIQGVEVTLIDANHCPGSVMFLLRLPNNTTYLHSGDCRFTLDMLTNKFLEQIPRVDCLYLDTTYCDPRYDFPTQNDSISAAIDIIKKRLAYRPKTLIVCGTYSIGKERVFCAIADAINSKVFCEYDKRRTINALENDYFKKLVCDKDAMCRVHVLSMQKLNPKFLSEYLANRSGNYTNILAVKPSGWEFSKGKGPKTGQASSNLRSYSGDTVTILGIPYSEHSSFSELEWFVKATKPRKVQPTVNVGNPKTREDMTAYIDSWLGTC